MIHSAIYAAVNKSRHKDTTEEKHKGVKATQINPENDGTAALLSSRWIGSHRHVQIRKRLKSQTGQQVRSCCLSVAFLLFFTLHTLYDGVLADNKPEVQTMNNNGGGSKLTGRVVEWVRGGIGQGVEGGGSAGAACHRALAHRRLRTHTEKHTC